ncbi:MAG: aspartate aminotransferase family protein [Syntrophorhabdus aromaticivorans]|uniref:Aspartate aminotransferase family protein n=1 Tax=Syntrophorhabdus aromaticivorans TaxID=328301 RepID=A0A971M1N1_9BACT|nr:aspartate aminotransferase family protein [Syntrophorhabdus aromaticivorans]
MKLDKSKELWEEGKKYMPRGVSAGGRLNVACDMPHYIDHAEGARLYTADGEEFIDYHGGSGASMFGHKHPRIKAALEECIDKGFLMNFDTEKTLEFAKNFTTLVPTVEKFRLLNSGTEATMAAIRIARGYTGKDIIIKLDGHFHGMHEMVWYNHNYYPPIENGICETVPDSAGIPHACTELVKVAESNNFDAVEKLVEQYRGRVAAIIFEPICFNVGCSVMRPEFIKGIRKLCDDEGICMIMDEVITGLRFRPGSAAGYYGVQPDITTFGKALGSGASISLVGGKAKVMDICSPGGIVGVSGTNSGNQLSVYAANACVKMALEPGFYENIESLGGRLYGGMEDLMKKHGLPGHVSGMGARFALYWGYEDREIDNDLRLSQKLFRRDMANAFINGALDEGLYFHSYWNADIPSHCGFSVQHTLEDIDYSLEKMDLVMKGMKKLV